MGFLSKFIGFAGGGIAGGLSNLALGDPLGSQGVQDFFLGSNIGLDPKQQDIFNQLLGFQPPVGQGLQDLFG